MDYGEALAFLESRIRWGMRPGTERVAALVEALDHPERSYPVLHISGTNGKFSVATMATSILTALGRTVGTYTSPHIESIRERIAIGGAPLDEATFARVLTYLEPFIAMVETDRADHVTFFELLTVMAFEAFFDHAVHVAVLEAGLGGEYDATNVAHADVAVLVGVSQDHVRQFGGDLTKATWEKAGIAKKGSIVITGIEDDELYGIVQDRAAERGAGDPIRLGSGIKLLDRRPAVGGQVLTVQGLYATYEEVFISLFGSHQANNAVLAIAACEGVVEAALDRTAIEEALGAISAPGRVEICGRQPLVICDGGHNPAAARAVRDTVEESFVFQRLLCVIGMLDDKLIDEVVEVWAPITERFIVTAPRSDRAASPETLIESLEAAGVSGQNIGSVVPVEEAVSAALAEAAPDDLILVTGSFTTVGEARSWLRSRGSFAHP